MGDFDVRSSIMPSTGVPPSGKPIIPPEEKGKSIGGKWVTPLSSAHPEVAKTVGVCRRIWQALKRLFSCEKSSSVKPQEIHAKAKIPLLTPQNAKALKTLGVYKEAAVAATDVLALMMIPEGRTALEAWAKRTVNGENIEFLAAVDKFKLLCKSAEKNPEELSQVRKQFDAIRVEFIGGTAHTPVNIPGDVSANLTRINSETASFEDIKKAFSAAERNIADLVNTNFRTTPENKKLQEDFPNKTSK